MAGPVVSAPDSEVASVVGAGVTVSVSDPHELADPRLLASLE